MGEGRIRAGGGKVGGVIPDDDEDEALRVRGEGSFGEDPVLGGDAPEPSRRGGE